MSKVIQHMTDASLTRKFELQQKLIEHFQYAGHDIQCPVDITSKAGQKACRDTGLKAVEELFEAFALLKNAKQHRKTDVPEFDREHFLEEISDSLHFQLEMLLMLGVTPDELFAAYEKKNKIVHERIDSGY